LRESNGRLPSTVAMNIVKNTTHTAGGVQIIAQTNTKNFHADILLVKSMGEFTLPKNKPGIVTNLRHNEQDVTIQLVK